MRRDDDSMAEPFREFLSQEGSEVTVVYVPKTNRYLAVFQQQYEDPYYEYEDAIYFEEVMLTEPKTAA